MIRPLSTLLAIGLVATPAFADNLGPATVEMGTRTFLVGQIPWEYEADQEFLPINGIDWVKDIMDADPAIGPRHVVFYLEDERPSLSDNVRTNWAADHYGNSDLVPDEFRIEGLEVQVRPDAPQPFASYLYLDGGDDPAWMTSCSFNLPFDGTDDEFIYCLMRATYPVDPDLHVGLRIYGPPPMSEIGASFPALAARMVEILTCLDVTHDVPATPADGHARLALLRAENPELRDCEPELSS